MLWNSLSCVDQLLNMWWIPHKNDHSYAYFQLISVIKNNKHILIDPMNIILLPNLIPESQFYNTHDFNTINYLSTCTFSGFTSPGQL